MDREELGLALLLSFPVAVGVALAVLKQTLGSQPVVAFVAGLTAGGLVFGVVAAAVRTDGDPEESERLLAPVADALPDVGPAAPVDVALAAGLGALVTLFLWYIPLSPLLGGAVAGFLGGNSMEEARTAGMLSGALVPVLGLVVAAVAFLAAGATVFGRFPFGPLVAVLVAAVAVVYAVALGRVGGWVGWKTFAEDAAWGSEV